jgi:hypothetical protein
MNPTMQLFGDSVSILPLVIEGNLTTRRDLTKTPDSRKTQLAALQQLQGTIGHAELRVENTVSSLGTIYSQVLTTQSTDQAADYKHLSAEICGEVRTPENYLEVLTEVKLSDASYVYL